MDYELSKITDCIKSQLWMIHLFMNDMYGILDLDLRVNLYWHYRLGTQEILVSHKYEPFWGTKRSSILFSETNQFCRIYNLSPWRILPAQSTGHKISRSQTTNSHHFPENSRSFVIESWLSKWFTVFNCLLKKKKLIIFKHRGGRVANLKDFTKRLYAQIFRSIRVKHGVRWTLKSGGAGGAESTKSQIYHYKNKKIHIFPKIWEGGRPPPCPPGSGPHDRNW